MFDPTVALLFLAEVQAAVPPRPGPPPDFRDKVYLAYTLVFACIALYLFLSWRRNAALKEEVHFLERRIRELEKTS